MPIVELITIIKAAADRVFDLSRSIDLHIQSTVKSGGRSVAGVTSGLIEMEQEDTWRAIHIGMWQTLTVRITVFERPTSFTDTMQRGSFKSMEHQHYFEDSDGGTVMRDLMSFQSPLGILGPIVDVLVLKRYMTNLLIERNRALKEVAECDGWGKYIG